MEFLKRHYEKILLSFVLLGLAAAAAYLPIKIKQNQGELERPQGPVSPPSKPAKVEDISKYKSVLEKPHPVLMLSLPHNLFNPVQWQKTPDGRIIKIKTGNEIGIGALKITKINPLRFILSIDNVTGRADQLRYMIGVVREADAGKNARKKTPKSVSAGGSSKGDLFILQEVVGPPESPTALVLELADSKQRITLTRDQPFTRVDGYEADLKYDPENKKFPNRRQMSQSTDPREYQIEVANEKYNIVAITEKDVTISSVSTSKRTTIEFKP